MYEYQLTVFDPDPDQTFKFFLKSGPDGIIVSEQGFISWSPATDQQGDNFVEFGVTDGKAEGHVFYNIKVVPPNTPPVISAIPDTTMEGGTHYFYQIFY